MRLLMLGTGPFAVPTFAALLDEGHQVPLLITRPVPPAVGRQKAPPNPMRDLAEQRGVPVQSPADVNEPAVREQLAALQADLMVVCDYGQILSAAALATTALGGINLHASLLPRYRGAAPINWALLEGCTETGVTVIHMTPRLDGGPCLVQQRTPIGPTEDAVQLEQRLAQLGVAAVREAIGLLAAWDRQSALGMPQERAAATKAPRLQKSQGQIDWRRTAQQLSDQVRALKPWPGTFTTWRNQHGAEVRLIVDQASVVAPSATTPNGQPGETVLVDKHLWWIATGDGVLSLDRVQPAGKRVFTVDEFLRGHAVQAGDRLG